MRPSPINPLATPALAIPLPFLLAAPVWAIVAGLLLTLQGCAGEAAALTRWSPTVLALTHLITLGVMGNAMLGALLQFAAVAANVPPPVGIRGAVLVWLALQCGTATLAMALATGHHRWLLPAAGLLLPALVACVLPLLIRLAARWHEDIVAQGLCLTAAALPLALAAGAVLVGVLGLGWPRDLLAWVDAHAALGAIAWTFGLLCVVGFHVIPMFTGAAPLSAAYRRSFPPLLAAAVLSYAGARLVADRQLSMATLLVAGLVAVHLVWQGRALWQSKRPSPTRSYFRLAYGAFAAVWLAWLGTALAGRPAPASLDVLIGAGWLFGGAVTAIYGMLGEIVPFLVWIAVKPSSPGYRSMPLPAAMVTPRQRRQVLALHVATLAALAVGLVTGGWPLAIAGGCTVAAAVLLLAALCRPALLWHRQAAVQPGCPSLRTRQ